MGPETEDFDKRIEALKKRAVEICRQEGWELDWRPRGCYLHLESSELIEALRGKGRASVTEEAADVFFVLLTILHIADIPFMEVVHELEDTIARLETGEGHRRYPPV
jgi:NTP pyrophosphatase (non-canonical NTP hydrolase)